MIKTMAISCSQSVKSDSATSELNSCPPRFLTTIGVNKFLPQRAASSRGCARVCKHARSACNYVRDIGMYERLVKRDARRAERNIRIYEQGEVLDQVSFFSSCQFSSILQYL